MYISTLFTGQNVVDLPFCICLKAQVSVLKCRGESKMTLYTFQPYIKLNLTFSQSVSHITVGATVKMSAVILSDWF